MIQFVQSNQVVGVNGQKYIIYNYVSGVATGLQKTLAVANMIIVNSFWLIPKVQGGKVIGYTEEVAANTSTPPTPDSLKILRLKDLQDQTEYDIAIVNTDNVSSSTPINKFADLVDGTGGSLPIMPTVTIPFPIIQDKPSSTDGTNNVFTFAFPVNPLGLLYSIPKAYFNGLASSPAYAPTGITTAAQFVTWANANWSAYGTWTSSGNIVKLSSLVTNVKLAGMIVALQLKSYCFSLAAYSTPATVNQVRWGSGGTLISVPAFQLTDDPTVLLNVLSKVTSPQSTTFGTAVANKLQVNTVLDVPKLYNNGSLVVTSVAGVCS